MVVVVSSVANGSGAKAQSERARPDRGPAVEFSWPNHVLSQVQITPMACADCRIGVFLRLTWKAQSDYALEVAPHRTMQCSKSMEVKGYALQAGRTRRCELLNSQCTGRTRKGANDDALVHE